VVDEECLEVKQVERRWRKQVKRVGGLLLFHGLTIRAFSVLFLGRGRLLNFDLFFFNLGLGIDSLGAELDLTCNANISGQSKNAS
jgi:hypothetical protein